METFLRAMVDVLQSQLTGDAVIFAQTSVRNILTPKLSRSGNVRHQRYAGELCRSHVGAGRRYPDIASSAGIRPILDYRSAIVDRLGEGGEGGQRHGGLPVYGGGAARRVEAGDRHVRGGGL